MSSSGAMGGGSTITYQKSVQGFDPSNGPNTSALSAGVYGDIPEMQDLAIPVAGLGSIIEIQHEGIYVLDTAGKLLTIGISLDGNAEFNERNIQVASTGIYTSFSVSATITGIVAGTHSVKIRWKAVSGLIATAFARQRSFHVKVIE